MTQGSCFPGRTIGAVRHIPIALWTTGEIQLQFQRMKDKPPFRGEEARRALVRRLNEIPGVALPTDAHDRFPSIKMAVLADKGALAMFLEALEWYLARAEDYASAASAPGDVPRPS